MYSRHEVMLLDDIFSALDPATMNIIVTNLLSRHGLFRKLKTTVIIVSNNGMKCIIYWRLQALIFSDN